MNAVPKPTASALCRMPDDELHRLRKALALQALAARARGTARSRFEETALLAEVFDITSILAERLSREMEA